MVMKFLSAQKIVQKTTVFAMYICLEQKAVIRPAVIKLEKFIPSVGAIFSPII
jgi:hypothetical protein